MIAEPGDSRVARSLDDREVISAFERHGTLLFRGFDFTADGLTEFTDRFTARYANDAPRREARYGTKVIRTVEGGTSDVLLHSEASFSAKWPELVWFFCAVPPVTGGATTLCDGVELWKRLSAPTKRLFLSMPVKYEVELAGKKAAGGGVIPWPVESPGVRGEWDRDRGLFCFSVIRFAVHETRARAAVPSLAFANYLVVRTAHREVKSVSFADGTPIAPETLAEVDALAAQLTVEVKWQSGDLLMIDNMRVMHGRRAFASGDPRDIVTVQTEVASFAYGTTTRSPLSLHRS